MAGHHRPPELPQHWTLPPEQRLDTYTVMKAITRMELKTLNIIRNHTNIERTKTKRPKKIRVEKITNKEYNKKHRSRISINGLDSSMKKIFRL